mgnify:CR=1 FL=1
MFVAINQKVENKYKDFFTNKSESVLKINKLYNEIVNKTNLIKNSLEENIKNIDKNKNKFNEENYNKEQDKLINEIQSNKELLKHMPFDVMIYPKNKSKKTILLLTKLKLLIICGIFSSSFAI